jgi:hypothetical protein
MKNIFKYGLSLTVLALSMTACDDWTETESLDLSYPSVEESNPELYANYLETLRAYKSGNHTLVYAWFDNKDYPTNRATHLSTLPDSLDVVSLINPANVADFVVEEMTEMRTKKGTKYIYDIDYSAFKASYDSKKELATEANPLTMDFNTFLADSIKTALTYVDKYGFDGICVAYDGKSTLHLTSEELADYTTTQQTFIKAITDWKSQNGSKSVCFFCKPENLLDKSLLNDCNVIFLSDALSVSGTDAYDMLIAMASVDGVPAAKLALAASATQTDDKVTGWLSNGDYALNGLATWAMGAKLAGVGVINVERDYYNPSFVFPFTRNLITSVNPLVK